ncbi:MAG: ABC transporter permease, partial [Acidimicrobiia bacterium]
RHRGRDGARAHGHRARCRRRPCARGGAVDASWVDVGADFRIETRSPEVLDELRSLPDTVVAASGSTRVNLDRAGETYGTTLLTVDVAELGAITDGTAADDELSAVLETVRPDGSIPVVASRRVNGRLVRTGDRFDGIGNRSGQVFHVIGIEAEVLGRDSDFVLADRSVVEDASGQAPAFNSVAIGAPDTSRPAVEAIAERAGERVRARVDVLDSTLDDPLGRAVRRGFLVAAAFSLALALVALSAVSVVTARQRQREVAILGLLGAGRRETVAAVVAELVPAALMGTSVGTLVGWLVARSYDGRFDLSSFAAGTPVSIRVDTVGVLVAAGAVAVASFVVIAVLVRRIVRVRATDILRIDGSA